MFNKILKKKANPAVRYKTKRNKINCLAIGPADATISQAAADARHVKKVPLPVFLYSHVRVSINCMQTAKSVSNYDSRVSLSIYISLKLIAFLLHSKTLPNTKLTQILHEPNLLINIFCSSVYFECHYKPS